MHKVYAQTERGMGAVHRSIKRPQGGRRWVVPIPGGFLATRVSVQLLLFSPLSITQPFNAERSAQYPKISDTDVAGLI